MRLLLLLAALLAALVPAGCDRSAPAPAAQVDADPALWVVRDADTTIYLFGTVHVLRPGLGWFDEAVRDAFDASGRLVVEAVPPGGGMAALVRELGTSADPRPLRERIPAALRPRLAATLAEYGQPADALDTAEPWLAAMLLTALPVERLGYARDSGAEAVLQDAARRAGKPVAALETAREQLGYFDSLSPEAQMAMLRDTLAGLDTAPETLDTMMAAWGAGDPDRLARLMNEDLDSAPELAETILFARNRRWAAWIAGRMAEPGTVFVAVGAGHLAGPNSVQAALAARRLTVERIAY